MCRLQCLISASCSAISRRAQITHCRCVPPCVWHQIMFPRAIVANIHTLPGYRYKVGNWSTHVCVTTVVISTNRKGGHDDTPKSCVHLPMLQTYTPYPAIATTWKTAIPMCVFTTFVRLPAEMGPPGRPAQIMASRANAANIHTLPGYRFKNGECIKHV